MGNRVESSELLLQVMEVMYLRYFLKVSCPPLVNYNSTALVCVTHLLCTNQLLVHFQPIFSIHLSCNCMCNPSAIYKQLNCSTSTVPATHMLYIYLHCDCMCNHLLSAKTTKLLNCYPSAIYKFTATVCSTHLLYTNNSAQLLNCNYTSDLSATYCTLRDSPVKRIFPSRLLWFLFNQQIKIK
jgi:hypothetical protein